MLLQNAQNCRGRMMNFLRIAGDLVCKDLNKELFQANVRRSQLEMIPKNKVQRGASPATSILSFLLVNYCLTFLPKEI